MNTEKTGTYSEECDYTVGIKKEKIFWAKQWEKSLYTLENKVSEQKRSQNPNPKMEIINLFLDSSKGVTIQQSGSMEPIKFTIHLYNVTYNFPHYLLLKVKKKKQYAKNVSNRVNSSFTSNLFLFVKRSTNQTIQAT